MSIDMHSIRSGTVARTAVYFLVSVPESWSAVVSMLSLCRQSSRGRCRASVTSRRLQMARAWAHQPCEG